MVNDASCWIMVDTRSESSAETGKVVFFHGDTPKMNGFAALLDQDLVFCRQPAIGIWRGLAVPLSRDFGWNGVPVVAVPFDHYGQRLVLVDAENDVLEGILRTVIGHRGGFDFALTHGSLRELQGLHIHCSGIGLACSAIIRSLTQLHFESIPPCAMGKLSGVVRSKAEEPD